MRHPLCYFQAVIPRFNRSKPSHPNSGGHSSENKYGLEVLEHVPDNAVVDIVFVHGLTGGRESTWTDKSTGVFWPGDLLQHDIPNARIMSFGFDADVVHFWTAASQNRLGDHGRNLAGSLANVRLRSETVDRPIIFVAHSLGGLVCEQTLLHSNSSAERHIEEILKHTKAIAFLGTPHYGSDFANLAKVIGNVTNSIKRTNVDIIRVLKPNSEVLAMTRDSFHTMLRKRLEQNGQIMKITCFYEELPVTGIGEVVPKHSAILPAHPSYGIHADHQGMTKFRDANDPGYLTVCAELSRWIVEIQRGSSSGSGIYTTGSDSTAAGSERTGQLALDQPASSQLALEQPTSSVWNWKAPEAVLDAYNRPSLQIYNNTTGGSVIQGNNIFSSGGGSIYFGK